MNAHNNLFAPLGLDNAPEKSRPFLEKIQKAFKFIPNLFGVFANSPTLLEGYLGLERTFDSGTLSAVERQVVFLSASVENNCSYCTAAHSTVLKSFLHVPKEVVSAIRSKMPLADTKLNALVDLTREIVSQRGHVRAETTETFLAAGYRKEQLLEVIVGVGLKTMSNYLDHLSPTELDPAFRSEA